MYKRDDTPCQKYDWLTGQQRAHFTKQWQAQ